MSNLPQEISRPLSARQVALATGINLARVLEWLQAGKLPAFRIGKAWKVLPSDVSKFLEKLAREGTEL